MSAFATALGDGLTIARRDVKRIRRVPELIVFSSIGPIVFLLLFTFVFGSAIQVPGGVEYRDFLIAGIFTQTVVFGAARTGFAITADVQQGMIDRFRTLPMAPSALLLGRTGSDVLLNVLTLVVMSVTALLVGWRIHTSPLQAMAGYGLMLLFAYALSWVMALVALWVRSTEVLNNAEYIVIFPLTFIANTFVSTENLPAPLRGFAEWNPVSAVTQATRELFGNDGGVAAPPVWPLRHPVLASLAWIGLVLLVFVPLAIRSYRRAVSR